MDKELRTTLAEALKDALQRAIDGHPSTLIALPREAMRSAFPELLLLRRAAEAFRKEAATSGLDFDEFAEDVPEQPLPEALMETGLLTEADLQAAREEFEKEWAKKWFGPGRAGRCARHAPPHTADQCQGTGQGRRGQSALISAAARG
ncbi:MAG: hypothetical protein U1F23_03745 [Lysobacterales bacterium]